MEPASRIGVVDLQIAGGEVVVPQECQPFSQGIRVQSIRKVHHAFSRSGIEVDIPELAKETDVSSNAGTMPSMRALPWRIRVTLASGPSRRSRCNSDHVAAKPTRRCKSTTRARFHGAEAEGTYGDQGSTACQLASVLT